jgi:hypothetical protein
MHTVDADQIVRLLDMDVQFVWRLIVPQATAASRTFVAP